MNSQDAILNAIQNAPGFDLSSDWELVHLQENAYRLSRPEGAYFVKWIADGDAYGQNEIRVNQEILAKASLSAPRLLHVLLGEQGSVACWEWLEGTDLRFQSRHLLVQAFASLRRFHDEQRYSGAVFSPSTQQIYPTIDVMLQTERQVLCASLGEDIYARCAPSFDLLGDTAYATLIHGDMHPGNLRQTERGLVFVDWGFALRSLNLFDLDYVQSVDLGNREDMEWWDINTTEAELILPAYFENSALSASDIRRVHRAVMVWSQLRSHFNASSNGNETGSRRCRENLERLLNISG